MKKTTLGFLSGLSANNHKEWFDAQKKNYQDAKTDVEQLADAIVTSLSKIDTDLVGLEGKKCTFRIFRDVRFSTDKTPYKTNMGFWMAKGGKSSTNGGYYLHIEPGKSFIAAGLYMPQGPELKKVRQEIAYCFDEFTKIINSPDFASSFGAIEIDGHKLQRVPQGFDPLHPSAEYLKLKSFVGVRNLTDDELLHTDLIDNVVKNYQIATPFVHFLNRALED